jgi:hypothetical protein
MEHTYLGRQAQQEKQFAIIEPPTFFVWLAENDSLSYFERCGYSHSGAQLRRVDNEVFPSLFECHGLLRRV